MLYLSLPFYKESNIFVHWWTASCSLVLQWYLQHVWGSRGFIKQELWEPCLASTVNIICNKQLCFGFDVSSGRAGFFFFFPSSWAWLTSFGKWAVCDSHGCKSCAYKQVFQCRFWGLFLPFWYHMQSAALWFDALPHLFKLTSWSQSSWAIKRATCTQVLENAIFSYFCWAKTWWRKIGFN